MYKNNLNADLILEEGSYELTSDGTLKIDKSIFDDFVQDAFIDIIFIDGNSDDAISYIMVAEDEDWIYCEFLG